MNIAHNLERSQGLFPHKAAIIFESESLTYQELNRMSNRIANGLSQWGVACGDRVALFLPNIPAFMACYFAIQKLGAIAVTLNASLKAQETGFILNDSGAKIVITTAALRGQLNRYDLPLVKQILIAEGEAGDDLALSDLMANASPDALAVDRKPDDPAVIIYTSGTTGFPKGATLSQGNILSTVRTTTYTLRLQADDRIMLCLPAFHNYGQYATFNPCVNAAATLILHRDFELESILRSIDNDQVSTFFGVPTLYTLLCDKASPKQLASLTRCISAGASLPVDLSEQWQNKFGLAINQIYGLTECSMAGYNHYLKHQPGSIGMPVENTEFKIVDETGQTVPVGELGEIAVRGPGVMLGYWNQPEATALAIKDGWFHTGDIGRQDTNGYYYILDRLKDMVNIGGEKVYTSEVEHVLYQHPAVAEVAVYGVAESLMGEQVRAAIILKSGYETTAEELKNYCRQALADYKVPSVITFVDTLPKSRTGKILKRLLRDEAVASTNPTTNEQPITSHEHRAWLNQWLRENLALPKPVGPDQPFNECGLTSLLAVKLAAELSDWLNIHFAPLMIWNYPTLNRLSAYLSEKHDSHHHQARMELWPAIDPYHVYDPLMYQRMMNDTVRTDIYRRAIEQTVANKIVLEIGPGPEANLTRLCADAGAKHIYAVELDATACKTAQTLINQLGLADKITLIHGDVTQVTLPETPEVCVSGLAGQIGGTEGVVVLINKVRPLLTPDALIIPQRYVSKIAAVSLPELTTDFTPLGWQYAHKIIDQVGHPFDLMVIINHFEKTCIISDSAVFEEIDFSPASWSALQGQDYPTDFQHPIRLTITENRRLDGFIIWLNLHTVEGVMMDVLEKGDLWLPVYFPAFYPGIQVSEGDIIEATCIGSLSDNGINPDYRLKGRLIRAQGDPIAFDHIAAHHEPRYQQTQFYRELFAQLPTEVGEKAPTTEPIAIIGLGCRFPGEADTLDKFWDILKNGVDTVGEMPHDRWDIDQYYSADLDANGKMYMHEGAFLKKVDAFDATFFGISRLEALSLDPQQRLLLEVCWESLENAGIAPHDLRHSQTGVFIGSFLDDYSALNMYQDAPEHIDAYRLTSSLRGMNAGRLSYVFQLHGPSIQVDTACSSSLLSVHLACQSLRTQECDLALAGGVTLFLAPENMIGICRAHATAPDGRTKAFAESANGFGVGEGAGVVLLKRLTDAKRDGDRILAVIRGSAVNHDGPSNGLTAPNGLAQVAVIRQALHNAGTAPDEVEYVETHGTGTPLGDPIEVDALGQVFAPGRNHPLMIGSVKSNIGHLCGAAGVASLAKVVLALQHSLIPASLHFEKPNSHIRWDTLPIKVPTEAVNWSRKHKVAGVSSFGMTGTNAHIIVEEAPEIQSASVSTVERPYHLLTLSGKTEQALNDQVTRYQDYLSRHPELNLTDVCYTANTGRVHFEHRLAVCARDLDELQNKLVSGETIPGRNTPGKVAFLFTGQGSQYVEMGRELFETNALFRKTIVQCDAILHNYLATSLVDLLYATDKKAETLDQTQYTQPALFALEYALALVWQSWGVRPEVLIGHSVGEYAAACLAGVFSLADGLKLIAERGRLMQALPLNGGMVAVQTDEQTLTAVVQPYLEHVSIATFNAPQSLVISGENNSLELITNQLTSQGIKCTRLAVSHAFHSPLMGPMLAEFERVAKSITYHVPRIQLISNLSGTIITELNADYWVNHVSQPVRFAQGMTTLADLGVNAFVEIGPKPILLGLGRLTVTSNDAIWLASLYPKQQGDWEQMLASLATLYMHGQHIDWRSFDSPYSRQKVTLPTYPFQRQRYWVDNRTKALANTEAGHPLLGTLRRSPTSEEIQFQTKLSINYLSDHQVFNRLIFPGAAYLEMAVSAAKDIFEGQPFSITAISFQQPLILTEEEITLACVLSPEAEGYQWQVFSSSATQTDWLLHSTGMAVKTPLEPATHQPLTDLQDRCPNEVSVASHYQACAEQGLDYGPAFQGIEKLYQGTGEALGWICLPESLQNQASAYQLHPALLDACLQVSLVAMGSESKDTYLPFALDEFQLYSSGDNYQAVWSYAKLRPQTESSTRYIDISLLNKAGEKFATLKGLAVRPASREQMLGSELRTDWLYQLSWQPTSLAKQSPYSTAGRWLIITDVNLSLAHSLAALLQAQGEQVDLVDANQPQALTTTYRGVIYLGGLSARHFQGSLLWWAEPRAKLALDYFPSFETLRSHLQADLLQKRSQIAFYSELHPQLEELSGIYVWYALERLGAGFQPGQRFTTQQLADRLGVISRHYRLFERLLEMCSEEGILQPTGEHTWQVMALPYEPTLPNYLDSYAVPPIELTLLERCGTRLDEVLRGQCDPLQLLFPSGDLSSATQLYRDSPRQEMMNGLVQTVIKQVIANLPEDRTLRILEVGGGTGGTTAHLLPHLPPEQSHYVFTDISSFFLTQAKEQFKDYPFVRYQSFNVEQSPEAQGLRLHQYDLVVAVNVIHATIDLSESLQHIHDLLAPGGQLVLLEVTGKQRWLDLTFGLTEGWWRFADSQVRADYPLLEVDQWQTLLQNSGFPQTLVFAPDAVCDTDVLQAVIVAQTPLLPVEEMDTPVDRTSLLSVPEQALALATQALEWVQQIIQGPGQPRLWLLTQEAIAENVTKLPISSSVLWGLGRSIMWEHPELQCSCLDLTRDTSANAVFETLWYSDAENQLRLQQEQRFIARLSHPQLTKTPEALPLHQDGSYLIVGGLGGLGLKIAAWLVEQGCRYLVLSGRRDADETARIAIEHLESLGAKILPVNADVSQEADVVKLLSATQQLAPLRGIIHSAGVLDDGILLQQTPERFAKVFAPKVQGTWHLHALSQDIPLDFFVCFSSIASLLGHGGQANHAAANAFQDALVFQRQQMGLPGLSINWGGWSEVGAAANIDIYDTISPKQGVELFGYMLGQSVAQLGVLPFNWSTFGKKLPANVSLPILNPFIKAKSVSPRKSGIFQQLVHETGDKQEALLKQHLRAEIQAIIGADPTDEQSFFDLGMDSLMSIQLSTRLATVLGLALPATLTLEYHSIQRLTAYLLELLNKTAASATTIQEQRIQPRPHSEDIPLSYVQQKVWTRQQINPDANLYNLSSGIRLIGEINVAWLEQSLQMIGQHHEVLRTTYPLIDGVAAPKVLANSTGNMTLIDLSHPAKPAQDIEAQRLLLEVTQGPFKLSEQTWRVALVKLDENNHLFIFCAHHLVLDAWSFSLFFNELIACYKALSEGKLSPLLPLDVQYADFAYWQRHYFTGERLASCRNYWRERLAKATPLLELPTDKPRPTDGQFFPSNSEQLTLSAELSRQVKAFSLRTGRTLYVTLLSAYMRFLSQLAASEEIVVISPVNKRNSPELESLIGHFSEMAILWINLSGNPTFEELQQRVYEMMLEAINEQEVPLEQVIETLLSGDHLTKDLPYRVSFNIIPSPKNTLQLPHIRSEPIVLDEDQQVKMIVDLALVIWEETEGDATRLQLFLRYRSDLFEAGTIRRMLADFERLLTQWVAAPDGEEY